MSMKNFGYSIEGRYKILVMRGNIICEERPWAKNLFLNKGRDLLLNGTTRIAFVNVCAVGTGTTTPAVTDTGLVNEIKRTSTILTGSGNTGSSWSGLVYTQRRTFDFSAETGSVNYTELGLSYTETSGNNLLTRALISGGTVSLVAGQQLRVVYDLQETFAPSGTQSGTATISGWPVSPATNTDITWTLISTLVNGIDTNGYSGYEAMLDIMTGQQFPPLCQIIDTTGGVLAEIGGSWGAYTSGSFTRTCSFGYLGVANANSTNIKHFYYGKNNYTIGVQHVAYVTFAQSQTKANTHRLRPMGFTVTIS